MDEGGILAKEKLMSAVEFFTIRVYNVRCSGEVDCPINRNLERLKCQYLQR